MRTHSYAIIGTGALGGFYGARLQRAGKEVHYLLHSDYEHVARHGLVIDSVDGDFTLPRVHAYGRPADLPACDVALVALKTTDNHLLPELLPPALGPDGVALVMQNGLGIEDQVAAIAGADRVLGGLAFLCSNKIGPGHIHHIGFGHVRLGDYRADHAPAGLTGRLRRVGADFEAAGIRAILSENLQEARWRKLVWNIPFNGLSTVMGVTTDIIMAGPASRKRVRTLMREVLAGAAACGYLIEPGFIDTMMEYTDSMGPYRPSMLIDYENGRPLEVEAIFGNPLRAARDVNTDLPAVEEVYEELRAMDARTEKKI
jgi:2-dehydropantoate 2-reductase